MYLLSLYWDLSWLLVGVSALCSVHRRPTLGGPFFAAVRRTYPRRTRPLDCSLRLRAHPLPPRHSLSSLPLINFDCCCHLVRLLASVEALWWPPMHHLPYDFHSPSGPQSSPFVPRLLVHSRPPWSRQRVHLLQPLPGLHFTRFELLWQRRLWLHFSYQPWQHQVQHQT